MMLQNQALMDFANDVAHVLFEAHSYTPAESFAAMSDERVESGFHTQATPEAIALTISQNRK